MRLKPSSIDLLKEMLKNIPEGNACLDWPRGTTTWGYGRFRIGGKNHQDFQVHRVAYELAIGPIPDGMCVCHRCDRRICFRPDHLWLGTYAENIHDCIAKKRFNHAGASNSKARLTEAQILEIRALGRQGLTSRQIAEIYGVAYSGISRICSYRGWKTVA